MAETDKLDIWVAPFEADGLFLFGTFDYENYKTEIDNSVDYYFKHEQKDTLESQTVRGVAIRYVNIGACQLTFRAVGMFNQTQVSKTLSIGLTDPTSTGNAVKNRQYYGAPPPKALADGKSYLAFFYFQPMLTDFDYQIQLHMDSDNTNQFMIEAVYVIGGAEEYQR